MSDTKTLTKKDFSSDQQVRWCPGCGDYSILTAVQKTLPELGIPKEKFVFVSGIGCSSRFPYYMNTYGFHTIHGRAPAIATGVKLANPDLSVWVITGDGDALSIGGNHLIHAIRRNVNINILLFNNEIYGLTKGQFSPTTPLGHVTKSTPFGSVDTPFSPLSLVIGAGATFMARTYDKNISHMTETFKRAQAHEGTSFVEILQNCNIFHDGAHEGIYGKDVREDNILFLEDGQPLLYGREEEPKGIHFNEAEAASIQVNDSNRDQVHVHQSKDANEAYAYALSSFNPSHGLPSVMGVLRKVDRPTYESGVLEQEAQLKARGGYKSLEELLHSGETWEIS